MARMHSRKKGKSRSKRPSTLLVPRWVGLSPEAIEQTIIKLYKEGIPPSKIGIILRDQYAVPSIKLCTGKSLKQILISNKLYTMPEDLSNLIKRIEHAKHHFAKNKQDKVTKRAIQLLDAKIHRLQKYYVKQGELPPTWRYR